MKNIVAALFLLFASELCGMDEDAEQAMDQSLVVSEQVYLDTIVVVSLNQILTHCRIKNFDEPCTQEHLKALKEKYSHRLNCSFGSTRFVNFDKDFIQNILQSITTNVCVINIKMANKKFEASIDLSIPLAMQFLDEQYFKGPDYDAEYASLLIKRLKGVDKAVSLCEVMKNFALCMQNMIEQIGTKPELCGKAYFLIGTNMRRQDVILTTYIHDLQHRQDDVTLS